MNKSIVIISLIFVLITIGCNKDVEIRDADEITAAVLEVDNVEDEEPVEKIVEDGSVVEEVDEEPIVTVKLCHDTDNGIIRWVNGTTFGFYDNASRFEFKDNCENKNYLTEYYCENEDPLFRVFLCKNGCEDSHCL